ncbi:hypothetical protein [Streptomyces sp. NPDC048277]|uniref:hypothetical protein n=1 Tax=Streptomyces sp. NPDC048277 TaxID=3155027 RepID=UPI0033F00056
MPRRLILQGGGFSTALDDGESTETVGRVPGAQVCRVSPDGSGGVWGRPEPSRLLTPGEPAQSRRDTSTFSRMPRASGTRTAAE